MSATRSKDLVFSDYFGWPARNRYLNDFFAVGRVFRSAPVAKPPSHGLRSPHFAGKFGFRFFTFALLLSCLVCVRRRQDCGSDSKPRNCIIEGSLRG